MSVADPTPLEVSASAKAIMPQQERFSSLPHSVFVQVGMLLCSKHRGAGCNDKGLHGRKEADHLMKIGTIQRTSVCFCNSGTQIRKCTSVEQVALVSALIGSTVLFHLCGHGGRDIHYMFAKRQTSIQTCKGCFIHHHSW